LFIHLVDEPHAVELDDALKRRPLREVIQITRLALLVEKHRVALAVLQLDLLVQAGMCVQRVWAAAGPPFALIIP